MQAGGEELADALGALSLEAGAHGPLRGLPTPVGQHIRCGGRALRALLRCGAAHDSRLRLLRAISRKPATLCNASHLPPPATFPQV